MSLLNSYFDKIYVINLKRRSDRLVKVLKRLNDLSIKVEVIEAVDGSLSEIRNQYEEYREKPIKGTNAHELEIAYSKKMIDSAGAWAYLLTYHQIISNAKHKGYQRILCFDDDVLFHNDFEALLNKALQNIPNDWKLLYLGATQHTWSFPNAIKYSDPEKTEYDPEDNYYHPLFTDGSFAVGIDSSVYELLLKEIGRMNCSFDSGPLRKVMRLHQEDCYVLQPNLVIADVTESDIREGRDQDKLAKKLKWDIESFNHKVDYDLISVIMPAYNAEATIGLSIQSILNQSYPNLELIIADDASTDKTVSIVQKIAKKDKRVKLIRNSENRGCYFVRNDAVRKSKGKFIAIQDADDYSLPNRLVQQVAPFYYSSCQVTIGMILRTHIDSKEAEKLSLNQLQTLAEERRTHKNHYDNYEYCCRYILGFMTTMYRKSVFEEIGLFWEEKHSMDMEYLERLCFHTRGKLMENDQNIHQILTNTDTIDGFYERIANPVLYSFQMGENNITNKYKTRKSNDLITLWRKRLRNLHLYEYPRLKEKKGNKSKQSQFLENQKYFLSKIKLQNLLNEKETLHLNQEIDLLNSEINKIAANSGDKKTNAKTENSSNSINKELLEKNAVLKEKTNQLEYSLKSLQGELKWYEKELEKVKKWGHSNIDKTNKWYNENFYLLPKVFKKKNSDK